MPRALLVSPLIERSGYSVGSKSHRLIRRIGLTPPLGLLTIAAYFPPDFELELVDMNVESLTDAHLAACDYVFASAMALQEESLCEVVLRANRAKKPIVVGGAYPTLCHEELETRFQRGGVDHFFLGEAEQILPGFLTDLVLGRAPPVVRAPSLTEMHRSLPPRYDLIGKRRYWTITTQFSRGCPYDCEFCDVPATYGRSYRSKTPEQMLVELERIYALGWRGMVAIADDNFVGNTESAKRLLAMIGDWQDAHGRPFVFITETTLNVARRPETLALMAKAGVQLLMIGIESPNADTLAGIGKKQNLLTAKSSMAEMIDAVHVIQRAGMMVSGAFIVGLDGDEDFTDHIHFVQQAGMPIALVSILQVLRGSRLFERLQAEGRLIRDELNIFRRVQLPRVNFVPSLPLEKLLAEYRRVVESIYDADLTAYFERCTVQFEHLDYEKFPRRRLSRWEPIVFMLTAARLLAGSSARAFLSYLWRVLRAEPRFFVEAIRYAVLGTGLSSFTKGVREAVSHTAVASVTAGDVPAQT